MKVRDRLKKVTDYKGRWTDAASVDCPCRPCFNAHDCGYRSGSGEWIISMECATRHSNGCPDKLPRLTHMIKSHPDYRYVDKVVKCWRCGQKIILGQGNFNFMNIGKH